MEYFHYEYSRSYARQSVDGRSKISIEAAHGILPPSGDGSYEYSRSYARQSVDESRMDFPMLYSSTVWRR